MSLQKIVDSSIFDAGHDSTGLGKRHLDDAIVQHNLPPFALNTMNVVHDALKRACQGLKWMLKQWHGVM